MISCRNARVHESAKQPRLDDAHRARFCIICIISAIKLPPSRLLAARSFVPSAINHAAPSSLLETNVAASTIEFAIANASLFFSIAEPVHRDYLAMMDSKCAWKILTSICCRLLLLLLLLLLLSFPISSPSELLNVLIVGVYTVNMTRVPLVPSRAIKVALQRRM